MSIWSFCRGWTRIGWTERVHSGVDGGLSDMKQDGVPRVDG